MWIETFHQRISKHTHTHTHTRLIYTYTQIWEKHPYKYAPHQQRKKNKKHGVPAMAQQVKNPTSTHEDTGLIPGLAQYIKDPVLLAVVQVRLSSDPVLLCLWFRPEAAARNQSLIPQPREPPQGSVMALKSKRRKKKNHNEILNILKS